MHFDVLHPGVNGEFSSAQKQCWPDAFPHVLLVTMTVDATREFHWHHQVWGTGARAPPPLASNNLIFQLTLECTKSDNDFVRLPLQTYLYSATAAALVQSRLREPCSVYYFASFYVWQKFHVVSCSTSWRRQWLTPLSWQLILSCRISKQHQRLTAAVDVVSCQTMVQLICWQQRSNVNVSETLIPTSTLLCWMKCSEITGQCSLSLSVCLSVCLLVCFPKTNFPICRAKFYKLLHVSCISEKRTDSLTWNRNLWKNEQCNDEYSCLCAAIHWREQWSR